MASEALPPTPVEQGRVVILDDHLLFAEALEIALVLEGYDVNRIPVPESTGSLTSVGAAIVRLHPQIALIDLDLGTLGSAIELIEPLTQAGIAVAVVTGTLDQAIWGQCLYLGARKVLTKSHPLDEILSVVRRLDHGLPVIDQNEWAERVLQWRDEQDDQEALQARLERLTKREREVLGHLVLGRTVSEIRVIGTVSEATVRSQVKSILAKLEVSSQIAAVAIVHRVGWQPPVS